MGGRVRRASDVDRSGGIHGGWGDETSPRDQRQETRGRDESQHLLRENKEEKGETRLEDWETRGDEGAVCKLPDSTDRRSECSVRPFLTAGTGGQVQVFGHGWEKRKV
ncbi:hypothetical protein BJV74DRAFT_814278 [Russula compacta]|nr:hypothetical protein BJV74DRAFT_814278 [Russula compacta]